MGQTPTFPPGDGPQVPKYWGDDEAWIMLVEFLHPDSEEWHVRGPEAVGCMYAFARMTNTRMLALLINETDQVYVFLFCFRCLFNKIEFLDLLQSNTATACEEENILIPSLAQIDDAKPLASVLPEAIFREVVLIAAMVLPMDGSAKPN